MALSWLHDDLSNEFLDNLLLSLLNWLSPCLSGLGGLGLIKISWLNLLRGRFSYYDLSSRSFNFYSS